SALSGTDTRPAPLSAAWLSRLRFPLQYLEIRPPFLPYACPFGPSVCRAFPYTHAARWPDDPREHCGVGGPGSRRDVGPQKLPSERSVFRADRRLLTPDESLAEPSRVSLPPAYRAE